MPRSPQIAALLRDLGPQLQLGPGRLAAEPPGRFATGIPDIDALLGGGFPRGHLSEIAGPPSSGRTSVALALLARATRAGEIAAVVDDADAFDPASAAAAGVRLECVLWVRAPRPREALRSTERLLEARGFDLVLLDLGSAPAGAGFSRLARTAASTGTALVQLGNAADGAKHFLLGQRWAAAHLIPADQHLGHHIGVDLVPQEMAGERGDGVVALPLIDPGSHKFAPVDQGVPGVLFACGELCQQQGR